MLSQSELRRSHEALLEVGVLAVAEGAVGGQGRRVVGADVEHDLVDSVRSSSAVTALVTTLARPWPR